MQASCDLNCIAGVVEEAETVRDSLRPETGNPFPLSGALHPGMLSAALQGQLPPPPHQPPTPPRTPQGKLTVGPLDPRLDKMPGLLAMAGFPHLGKPGLPPPPSLTNKQGIQGQLGI